jgi:acyl-coenzyme A synthetase/AMP-(fatty) acid ligase
MKNPVQHLLFRAKATPNFIAIQTIDRSYTFIELALIVKMCAGKLRSLGIRPKQLVINSFLDSFFDLILALSVFYEACISCSNHGYSPIDQDLECDWILTDNPARKSEHQKNQIFIDESWINDAIQQNKINNPNFYDSQSICRLVLTSGTTGKSKAAAFSYDVLDARVKQAFEYWMTPGRELNLMTIPSVGGIISSLSTLFSGCPIYIAGPYNKVQLIAKFNINSLIGSPIQLRDLLDTSNQLNIALDSIEVVRVAGGALSPALLEKIRKRLGAKVLNIYGCTEVGGVTMSELTHDQAIQSAAGYPLPFAEVQIVNDRYEILPPGKEGLIRVRSDAMAYSYYKNLAATEKFFKNGWFYSGDQGFLNEAGCLVLSGRDSELINRGGSKIDPALIDQFLLDLPGIEDAAVFGLSHNGEIEDIGAALVVSTNFDLKTLRAELWKKFGVSNSPAIFFTVAQIPRNPMGKVMRAKVAAELTEFYKLQQNSKS